MYTPKYPQRIICLTEEGTEILYAIAQQDRLVGISGFTYRPPQARKEKPKISTFLDAKFDDIIALKPDLVIGYSDLQADLAAELIRRGIDIYIFNHHTIEGILDMILKFTSLIGNKSDGLKLIETYNRNLDLAHQKSLELTLNPLVFFEEWYEPVMSGSTWVMELIEVCGGKIAFPELKNHFHAKNRIVTENQIIEANPEVIIGSWCGKMFKPEIVKARNGFANLKAVKNNQLYEIKSEFILQPGPAALTDGLRQLQNIIYQSSTYYSSL